MQRYRRYLIQIVVVMFIVFLPGCLDPNGHPDTPVIVSNAQTRYPLGLHLAYLEDPTGSLTFQEIASSPHSRRFTPSREKYPNFGLTQSAYWLRVTLWSAGYEPADWLLEIGPQFLDAIDVYLPHPNGQITRIHMGGGIPFHEREFPHRHFITSLRLNPQTEQALYLRIQDRSRNRVAMTLWEPDAFHRAQELWNLGYGTLYGATLMMGFSGILIFLMFKERIFLYFSFHAFISLLIFLSWNGFAYQYLWPNSVRWHNVATLSLYCLGVGIHAVFTAEFLRVWRYNPTLYRLMHLGALLAIGLLLGLTITKEAGFQRLFFILSIPTTLLFGIIGFYAWRKKEPAAKTYLLIWGLYSLSSLITVLRDFGTVPATPLTDHISQLTFVLTLPFISVRVANRLNMNRREKEDAQEKALRAALDKERLMHEQNVRLDEQVKIRTDALREAKAEVERSHETLQRVFDNLDMLIYVADVETYEILFVNARTRTEFGDVEGQICWQALQRGQTGPCNFCTNDRLIKDGEPTGTYRWEFQNTATGRWYHVQDQAFRWPDDRLVRIEVATDITDLKRAEQQLLEQHRDLVRLQERRRIGDTLHDDLGQVISYINVQAQTALGLLAQEEHAKAEAALTGLVSVAQEAHSDVREYIQGTRQPQRRTGFFETVADIIKTLHQRYHLRIALQLPDNIPSPPFPPEVETHVLAIVREALTNVAKHANVDAARLIVQMTENTIRIIVQDEGAGFSPGSLPGDNRHFGLEMMREHAESIGAVLDIIASPVSGTWVTLDVPRSPTDFDKDISPIEEGLRLLLVDDHPLFLDGLRHMLESQGIEIVATAGDGLEAVKMAEKHHPDMILMDVEMPGCGGVEATRRIAARFPDIRIAMLTVAVNDEVLFDALKAGASGYLLKNLESESLFSMLSDLMQDQVVIAPHLATRVLDEFQEDIPGERPENPDEDGVDDALEEQGTADLTPRQIEVLRTVARGFTYKEVGNRLYISERTVKYHMGQILERLQLKSRAQAITYATQQGLIDREEE